MILLGAMAINSFADTCPPIDGLNPEHPPAGWETRPSPYDASQKHYFGMAAHAFTANEDYGKIYCRYETCPSFLCSTILLVSSRTFINPPYQQHSPPPWDARTPSKFLISCLPGDHNPAHCVFN